VIWLVLAVVTSFAFGQLFKWSQRRGFYAPVVVSTNYLVVALMLSAVLVLGRGFHVDPQVLMVGSITGVAFITSMLLWTWALTVSNVTTALMAFRLSMLVPIVGGAVLWQEEVSGVQLLGISVALCSLLLMSMGGRAGAQRISRGKQVLIAFGIFTTQGIVQLCNRWVRPAGLDDQHLEVIVITTSVAAVIGSVAALLLPRHQDSPPRLSLPALRMGAGIGIFNGIALVIMLAAMSRFDGAQYFPINGCAVVIMDFLFAHFLWKERLSALTIAGAVLGGCSIFLVF
jgi:drug/metabolite transporter (DMT)-like permease